MGDERLRERRSEEDLVEEWWTTEGVWEASMVGHRYVLAGRGGYVRGH